MIKYNNSNINDWYYVDDNIIKVYRNNAVCYYKITTSGDTPQFDICYAVVENISQYSETEFEDVYDKATEKWYKLNNLNQYEEYGVYGDSIETSGTSRLPAGYTEVEYIRNSNYNAYINTGVLLFDNTQNSYTITTKLTSEFHSNLSCATIISSEKPVSPYNGLVYRYKCSSTVDQLEFAGGNSNYSSSVVDNGDGTRTVTLQSTGATNWTIDTPLSLFCSFSDTAYTNAYRFVDATFYSATIVKNGETVRDFIPAKRDSDDKYGLYDLVTDIFYTSPNDNNFSGGSAVTPTAATYYEGKLAIVDGYEYKYSGNTWVNVGEVSGSTATLPNVPFSVNYNANNYDASTKTLLKTSGQLVDVDAVVTAGTPTVHDGYLTIASGTRATISGYSTYFNRTNTNGSRALTIVSKQRTDGSNCHMFANRDSNYNWMYRPYSTKLTLHGSSETGQLEVTTQPVIESVRVQDSSPMIVYNNYTNNTSSSSSSFSYGGINSGKFAIFQGYCTGNGENFVGDFYWVYMSQNTLTDDQVQQVIAYNEGGGGQTEYPMYYDEKSDPLDNLSFNSMSQAEEYAYNNCVYDGMKATIAGDRYYFDSEDENGWVKVLSYYKVEDVTSGGASGWTITGSSTYNPDSSYYDDFDLVTSWTSYETKIAKVTIYGYDHFTYYLRAYNQYSAPNAYVVATNVDEISTPPSTMSYNSASAISNTYEFRHIAGTAVNLSNYRRVTYNNLDKTVEHTFYVYFYGRKYSNYVGDATILIPKEQTNENWEQVTFSASSNVASAQKSLYIDGNNSTSGGTGYWYYRWMIGLPSGSHSSYTNYSNYDYCPNVTSATFTSVAVEQRQVNYTYDSASNKNLQFRLLDTSGNTLTPSDTVYYNMTYYNSCGVSSSSSNVTFPRTQSVKVGGRFVFSNSSNRHYIYGYSPSISLNTNYYVDNYSTYFDITYTKLNTEAVTITYTTYDPNDTEIPAFKTDISWPYGNSGKTSNTLTSYDVPYTYSYDVSQTSDKFSASTYSYTAGQASRTISFTLYPNNREFSTVADMEAYQYAWGGMKASVDGTNYTYKNGEWVEQQYTQYEYIRTQNAATIFYDFITDFKPTRSHTIEVKVEFVDRSIDWGHLVSWYDGTASHGFSFQTVTSSYQAIVRTGGDKGVSYRPTIGANNPTVYTLPMAEESGTYSVNGGSSQTIQYNYKYMYLPANTGMCFFGRGTTSREKAAVAKMYYVKVYDNNNNLVKHYVPSDYNGAPCFYEIVDGDYILDTYTGSNHGTLTLGPEV